MSQFVQITPIITKVVALYAISCQVKGSKNEKKNPKIFKRYFAITVRSFLWVHVRLYSVPLTHARDLHFMKR